MHEQAELARKMEQAESLLREIIEAVQWNETREDVAPVLAVAMRKDRRILEDAAECLNSSLSVKDAEKPLSGADLKRIRTEILKIKSQEEFGLLIGRSRQTVQRMERSEVIEDSRIIRLALAALGANL